MCAKGIKAGDWVIISIGHNDNGPYDSGRARASIPGISEFAQCHHQGDGREGNRLYHGEYMRNTSTTARLWVLILF